VTALTQMLAVRCDTWSTLRSVVEMDGPLETAPTMSAPLAFAFAPTAGSPPHVAFTESGNSSRFGMAEV
jgi:hypothetical protein